MSSDIEEVGNEWESLLITKRAVVALAVVAQSVGSIVPYTERLRV